MHWTAKKWRATTSESVKRDQAPSRPKAGKPAALVHPKNEALKADHRIRISEFGFKIKFHTHFESRPMNGYAEVSFKVPHHAASDSLVWSVGPTKNGF